VAPVTLRERTSRLVLGADRRAAHLRRLTIANHTHPLTSSTIPIASHGHALHSSTQDWLVAVEVQTVTGPDRFKKAS
jgi:hypothetical protein